MDFKPKVGSYQSSIVKHVNKYKLLKRDHLISETAICWINYLCHSTWLKRPSCQIDHLLTRDELTSMTIMISRINCRLCYMAFNRLTLTLLLSTVQPVLNDRL